MKTVLVALLLAFTSFSLQAQAVNVPLAYGAVLTLERAPFKAAGKALTYYDSKIPNTRKSLVAINGKPLMGSDGDMPKYVLAKATLLLNGRRYNLPVADMYNPWFGTGPQAGPNPEFYRLFKDGTAYRLQALFADGAGSYCAEWRLVAKSAKRTILSSDEDVFTSFLQPMMKAPKQK